MGRRATGSEGHAACRSLLVRLTTEERDALGHASKSTGISMSRLAAIAAAGVAARMHGALPVALPASWPGVQDEGEITRSYFALTTVTGLEPYAYMKSRKRVVDHGMRVLVGERLRPGTRRAMLPREVVAASLGQYQRNRNYLLGVVADDGIIRWLDGEWRWQTENSALAAEVERLIAWGALLAPAWW